ncbi:MAG TPA: CBS domain-containing protein [Xanthomonadales bacterium]|nr:CBS domain-containing protein [Xanthomonadales bacterium]
MNKLDSFSLQFARDFPNAFARTIARFDVAQVAGLLDSMPSDVAAAVAARLSANRIKTIVATGLVKPNDWLEAASFDDAVVILGSMPREQCMTLVGSIENRKMRRRLRQFLNYPAHCVGAVVSDSLVRFPHDLPLTEMLGELQSQKSRARPPAIVIEQQGKYLGLLGLWQITLRSAGKAVAKDFAERVEPMRPESPLTNAVHAEQWRHHHWLPVVDHDQRVLGVVSRHQIMECLDQKEADRSTVQSSVSMLGEQYLSVMSAFLGQLLDTRRPK